MAIEFPHQREVYISYCQSAIGIGLLLGPVIGSGLKAAVGYEFTFYILGGILGAILVSIIVMLPWRINTAKKPDEVILEQRGDSRPSIQGHRPQVIAEQNAVDMVGLAKVSERYSRRSHIMIAQVNYKVFFTNLRAMTAVAAAVFAMIFMLFYEPVLTRYLSTTRKWVSEDTVGLLLAVGALTYAFSSPLVGYLCTITKRRYITCFSFINCAIALFLLGPSHTLNFPEKLGFSIAGIAYLGFSSGFINTPLLPEIISAV